jgi:2-(1,2-epoxy-1,2-dihydrophenyl)acetyl-CoA isomerase
MREIDTGTHELLARVEDGVAVLTLNRPERRNALNRALLEALARTLGDVEVDDEVGCVVLTGAGGAFCAGGDVKDMAAGADEAPFDTLVHRQRLNHRATAGRLHHMAKPTIAAIPGPAAGAGLSLALACDLRYAADGALMTTAFARVGFAGDYGGTWFLTQLVGPAKARELYFFSERIRMSEALDLGLVNGVFAPDELEAAVLERARTLAGGPRLALRYMQENLNRALRAPLEELLDLEATHHLHTGTTQDHREAAVAFVERREPVFTGR